MTPYFNSIHTSQSFQFPLPNNSHFLKRRRLKRPVSNPNPNRFLLLRNDLQPPPSDIFSFIHSNWIPTAVLGFASTLALSLSSLKLNAGKLNAGKLNGDKLHGDKLNGEKVGEWILYTSPTPFNRFVLLRCPSIAFEGVENVNENLVKEERHYVSINSGRIVELEENEVKSEVIELEYQRVCVETKDKGVISLDWPANLELSEERGLDTTVLVVPGTAEGSLEEGVRDFVKECLKRGFFPVVMNPRGCANSPLTTARLFTAADSDDICSAIQFITRARPWSTLAGVGWGYGANMLTKYLAEVGEKTPLTAATCINNPFDLDEATRTSPNNTTINKITGGLIDILKSNKELFQGKRKGFDLEKALAAESIRDFETAISMVSYGFESVEDFYNDCSTRSMIGQLKIPVLFIQNDDEIAPLFSVPRGLIAENPFTSLLLCSCVPSNVTAVSWYQQVTIEWLAAVELGLLKGRHPLLQDIDVTINPSKSFSLLEERSSDTNSKLRRLPNLAEVNDFDPSVDPVKKMLTESAPTIPATSLDLQNNPVSISNQASDLTELNSIAPDCHSVDVDSAETMPDESDSGQMLQTTQVVMNMLDVTMPGTLKEEEKRKVVKAVSQGETLIKALQDAVPEDVRENLTTSVSEILQTQGKNLNLDGLLSINQIANLSSGFKSEKNEGKQSNTTTETKDHHSDNKDSVNDSSNKNSTKQSDDVDKFVGESPEAQPLEKSPESSEILASTSASINSDDSGLEKSSIDSQNSNDKRDGEALQKNSSQDDNTKEQDAKDINMPTQVDETGDLSHDQDTISAADIRPDDTNEAPESPISGQLSENVDDDNISKDEKNVQPLPDQNKVSDATSPSFNVTQALDALTGLDDSTQLAVNSVFGVIETMITQLEEKKNVEDQKGNENNDSLKGPVLEKDRVTDELQLEKQTDGKDQEDACLSDIELANGSDSDNDVEPASNEDAMKMNLGEIAKPDKDTHISKIPSNLTTDPLTKALYKEYLQNYIISKLHNVKSLNLDATDDLYLHYVPEEGHWILLKKPRGVHDTLTYNTKDRTDIAKVLANEDDLIDPSYVILDKDEQLNTPDKLESKEFISSDSNLDNSVSSVKTIVLDSLKVEVSRRLSVADMTDMEAHLATDMEKVAEAVYLAFEHDKEQTQHASISNVDSDVLESNGFTKSHIVEAISKAVQDSSYLKRVLPVGVVVGSSLAALRNCCDGTAVVDNDLNRMLNLNQDTNSLTEAVDRFQQKKDLKVPAEVNISEPIVQKNPRKEEVSVILNSPNEVNGNEAQSQLMSKDRLMVGAVTAALGASAVFTTQQEDFMKSSSYEASSNSEETHMEKESSKLQEAGDNKHQRNIVSSLAEKAMSVAAPVVPTKEDGGVDHDRLVATLTELGQNGGMLRLVAKFALLWGGLRGAISLTDRLLSFLRVAERPLVQRILGYFGMVLVLWSPVLIPLLPTLFHNMATHNSSKIAELACIVGLYTAVTILTMQWGKRIRGYESPMKQYGLDLMSSRKIQDFLTGLGGGVVLVVCIHSVNALLGFVSFSIPTNLSASSLDLTTKLKAYGQLALLAGRGLIMAAGVTFVEELLFRSWLLEEVAADLGYTPAIVLSGLAFSLSQRSMLAIPGLWLLSVCLAGARLRKEGSLFLPIGLRTGIMSASFVMQTGGFLICQPRSQIWVAGMHPLQPFTGVVGILAALLLAVFLYPRQPGLRGRVPRPIRALKNLN